MGKPMFDHAGFIAAARALANAHGPAAVTVDSDRAISEGAEGIVLSPLRLARRAARRALAHDGAGLSAGFRRRDRGRRRACGGASHASLVAGASRRRAAAAALQPPRLRAGRLSRAAEARRARTGRALRGVPVALRPRRLRPRRTSQLKRATFVLGEVPIAAVKGYLERREAPPPLADELIEKTYRAIVGNACA